MSGTVLDVMLAVLLLIGAARGLATGALRQFVGLFGTIAAVWLAALMMRPIGSVLVMAFGVPESLGPIVGFIAVFVTVIVLTTVLAHLARSVLVFLRLGIIDRAAGALLGLARLAVMISVFLLVTSQAVVPGPTSVLIPDDAREDSVLHDPVAEVAPALWAIVVQVAPGVHEALSERFQGFSLDP